jgi:zinc protease
MSSFTRIQFTLLRLIGLVFLLFASNAKAILPIETLEVVKGAKAYLIQTKSLPIIDVEVSIDAGSRYDPENKNGLASLAAQLSTLGAGSGKTAVSEAQIADAIADLGASISVAASSERTVLRIRSLSRPDLREPVVQLAALILAKPSYDAKVVDREKQRLITALLEAQTKPETILQQNLRRAVYGKYPLAYYPTPKTVAAITAADIRNFHTTFYRGDRISINIVGDVDRAQANGIVQNLLAGLPQTGPAITPLPAMQQTPQGPLSQREVQIPFNTQQAHIAMGMTAITRNNPDFFPLLVGNYVLGGGGFVSRLMAEVREKRGLAYSISSYFAPGKDAGFFEAGMQTKKDQAKLGLEVMQQTISQFIVDGPTPEELVAAKSNLVNGYPLRLDSNRKLLDNLSGITWNDLPLDTMETWTKQVEAVTLEQIRAAFQKHLDMNRMQIVVVGASQ